ncbi:hypothetical protein TPY_0098 [Sulfobacillus acidophilus TPY]|nr:hypothetical protein TPY_0098 [Sulfobacillus acidophilus TPY]
MAHVRNIPPQYSLSAKPRRGRRPLSLADETVIETGDYLRIFAGYPTVMLSSRIGSGPVA